MSLYALKHWGMCKPIQEPPKWTFDGDLKRKEPVIDPNDNRVIRYVGHRRCITCQRVFFSGDVVRVRACDYCKTYVWD